MSLSRLGSATGAVLSIAAYGAVLLAFGCSGSESVAPAPVAVATVAFPGATDSVLVGQSRQLSVTTSDASSRPLSGRTVTWAVNDTAVARITPSGLVSGLKLGSTEITARSEGAAATITLNVIRVPVATVTFPITALTLNVGDTARVAAVLADAAGNVLTDRVVTYSSSAPGVLSVTPAGELTGVTGGTAVVTAAAGGRTADIAVTVKSLPVGKIVATPGTLDLAAGSSGVLSIRELDVKGNVTFTPLAYTSSNPAVVTVKAPGTFTAVGPGNAVISLSADGTTATIPVSVQTITPGSFRIELRFVGPPDANLTAAAQRAAARWERVLPQALAAQAVNLRAGACETLAPAITGTTTGVIVTIAKDSIDGRSKVLAEAGPCVARTGSDLPAVGAVDVDSADIAAMVSRGTLENVLTHELGHVLGIGTIWVTQQRNLLRGVDGSDPRYIGAGASREAAVMGFIDGDSTRGVEAENEGGVGSIRSHWRESVYTTEVMTSIDGPGSLAPLSRISAASLRDLGYVTREAGADFFSAATAASGGVSLSNGVSPSLNVPNGFQAERDIVRLPRFRALPTGEVIPFVPRRGGPAKAQ